MPFCNIVGHERAKEVLTRGLKNARVPQAYLFVGPEGVGKRHMALAFAKALNCVREENDFCDECPACRKTDRLCHPDVLLAEPQGNSLKIDQMRECQREISFKTWEGRYKVLILDGADKLTPEASNSLLKTLEEPPPATIIILISTNPFSIFPTLLSRCQMIRFGLLERKEVAEILKQKRSLEETQAKFLASLCGGKVGKALSLDMDRVQDLRRQAWELLIPKEGVSAVSFLKKARELSKDKEEMEGVLSQVSSLSRDLVVLACGGKVSLLINEDMVSNLFDVARSLGSSRALKVWEVVEQTQGLLRQNVNGQLALESMLIKIYRFLKWI